VVHVDVRAGLASITRSPTTARSSPGSALMSSRDASAGTSI
jgi:hypothetical protein